jgi:hypothetical protein
VEFPEQLTLPLGPTVTVRVEAEVVSMLQDWLQEPLHVV